MLYRLLVVIMLLGFSFYNLAHTDLQFWDEATNLGVVVESSQAHDWWNLRYNQTYFWEKPPLYYWLGIIIYKIFQPDTYQLVVVMRGLTAITSLGLIWLCYYYLQRYYSAAAAKISLLLWPIIPSLWLFNPDGFFATHHLRSADSDMLQLLFIMSGFTTGQILLKQPPRGKFFWLLVCLISIFSGLAIMTKGVFGLLPLLIFTPQFIYSSRNWKRIVQVGLLQLTTLLVIVLPWHLYMIFNFGRQFIDNYFIYHQLNRAGTSLEGHHKSITYFLEFMLNPQSSGILILFLVAVIIFIWLRPRQLKLPLVETLTALGLLLALSLVQTKLSWYSLYATLFLILATSVYLSACSNRGKLKYALVLLTIPIYLNFQTIRQLPANVYAHTNYQQAQVALTPRDLHRNFYYQQLQTGQPIINPSQAQPGVVYLVDRHELKLLKQELLYRELKITPLSPNYALLRFR